ncbi:MAG: hypothetical protein QNJ49_21665 [Mastigocoleus sp. MO_167.B18]|uniref:hypothetical protein n=1 Tax=Mastigocoleus sp. MO_188.B34 TaxID=3036635 RepID=UPI0026101879|nr:hypothetical protein [Mastigocoleus sp. MO_188.B34]MDJ0695476.1 hypothetical protein [Mastigocoleus sp. MO_188.B34]MDJ0775996.1 hypothetical protein [Mastigocoleus sp. MO_167.B18]
MIENNKNSLFTEINLEDATVVSGGMNNNVFEPFNFTPYYDYLYSNIPIAGFDPALMQSVYQNSFPFFNNAITTAFSNGSSSFDGLNVIQSLVNGLTGVG